MSASFAAVARKPQCSGAPTTFTIVASSSSMNELPQTTSSVLTADPAEQRRLIDAFLAAAHAGDFEALVAVLDPDVVFRMDLGGGRRVRQQRAGSSRSTSSPTRESCGR
jgi:hypothetical protein